MLRAAHTLPDHRFGLVIALSFVFVAMPARARAEENLAAVEKVTSLNKRALDAYNNLEFEDARKLLKQALELCAASGLDKHPIKARTHIHMGVVLIASKQQELGIKQFRKALDIQPDIQVTRSLANPEILQAFEEASSGGGGGGATSDGQSSGEGRPATRREEATSGGGIRHTPVTRGRRGGAVSISATVDSDLTGFTKVVIAYRAEGATDFAPAEMTAAGRRYVGQIPASATQGGRVAYYIEAETDDDSAVASAGSEDKPFTVFLTTGRVVKEEGQGGGEGREGGDDDDQTGGAPRSRFFVALLGGTGIGYTTGNGEVNASNKVSAGFAPSSAGHVIPELGYFLNPSWRLSLQLRFQFISGTTPVYLLKQNPVPPPSCGSDNICDAASNAFAGIARSSWLFGTGRLRPYFSLALGGGQIRHVVKFNNAEKRCGAGGNEVCVDTVKSGPVFAGAGGGLMVTLTPMFSVIAELNSLLGFPDFTAHFDINVGVGASF